MHADQSGTSEMIPIGILYSLSGAYGVLGREMVNGIMLAIEEVNADPRYDFTLAPLVYDMEGSLDRYYEYTQKLLYQHRVQHIFGCYTSAARKRILPLVEGANALLWYSARYEGFESSPNVIYLGASPNQHVLPLLNWLTQQRQPLNIYHVGSNYVWSWEIDRITREVLEARGGQMVGSELIAQNETAVTPVIEDILAKRPTVLLNTLVGESAYAFFRQWQTLSQQHPFLQSEELLRTNLILSEPEIAMLGAEAVEGTIVSGVWFQANASEQSPHQLARYQHRFGEHCYPFADSVAAWHGVHRLAQALQGSRDPQNIDSLRQRLGANIGCTTTSLRLAQENNHAWHRPQLARCQQGELAIFWQAPQPVKPDPWLTWVDLENVEGAGHGD